MSTPSAGLPDTGALYIGLMSGTSLDGVDGVLMRHEQGTWSTLTHAHRPQIGRAHV